MIDIADFAVGLSRQLYGLTMHSERPGHRMYEQWHPLGVVGVITAFNFPVAVWAWNSMLAPSAATPCSGSRRSDAADRDRLTRRSADRCSSRRASGDLHPRRRPAATSASACSTTARPARLVHRLDRDGQARRRARGRRFGRTILELGGNNAIIVMDDADLDLALRGDRVRRRRHRRPALHLDAPRARARVDRRRARARLVKAYGRSASATRWTSDADGPAGRRRRRRRHAGRPRASRPRAARSSAAASVARRPARRHFVEPAIVRAEHDCRSCRRRPSRRSST